MGGGGRGGVEVGRGDERGVEGGEWRDEVGEVESDERREEMREE